MQKIQQKIHWSEITPEHVYVNRRRFMQAGTLAAGALALAACGPGRAPADAVKDAAANQQEAEALVGGSLPEALAYQQPTAGASTDELGDSLNKFEEITNYNNFYEFSTNKESVAGEAQDFKAYPWTIEVSGLVNKPQTFAIEDIYKKFTQEERIYRLRCVEAWSMVIPWVGFPISALLKEVEPKNEAKFVRFVSVMRPEEMRGPDDGDPRVAVPGGPAHGRSHASPGDICHRHVRQAVDKPAGRAVPARGAVEIRL